MSLFDKYVHGLISRCGFHRSRVAAMALAGLSGAALLDALNPKFAHAQQIAPTDARLRPNTWSRCSGLRQGARLSGAARKAPGKLPAVLVVHENRGLNPHIEDIARRSRSRIRRLRARRVVSARRISR